MTGAAREGRAPTRDAGSGGQECRLVEAVGPVREPIRSLNHRIFGNYFVVEHSHRRDLRAVVAYVGAEATGFMIGRPDGEGGTFLIAKGGVVEEGRGCGVARTMLIAMIWVARAAGCARCICRTSNPRMKQIGLGVGFSVYGVIEDRATGAPAFLLEASALDGFR